MARFYSTENKYAVERDVLRANTDSFDSRAVIDGRLELVAVRLEFFAGRLELAAARRICVTISAGFSGLLGKGWRGIGRPRTGQGQRAGDQERGRRAANEDDGIFCVQLHIRFLRC
jgi:hypothetical protein